jgi:hypothetical protein
MSLRDSESGFATRGPASGTRRAGDRDFRLADNLVCEQSELLRRGDRRAAKNDADENKTHTSLQWEVECPAVCSITNGGVTHSMRSNF